MILEGTVPNPSTQEHIRSQNHPRFGRTCVRRILDSVSQRFKTIQGESLINNGPRRFPRAIRDLTGCKTEAFKRRLDQYLEQIPDEPPIPHGPTSSTARLRASVETADPQVDHDYT
ncbi:hypothetical protein Pcinc_035863 [Petrolisthes cinctipes]|uniref:Uncharacterized protein n=1 Tax=Petrolisthes cinctipes TaxID=88211 RepID=A0AAE1BYX4_PETCI|nr:hypothetical protein Pcinc_035863 [Petrolisthes cinctipes]